MLTVNVKPFWLQTFIVQGSYGNLNEYYNLEKNFTVSEVKLRCSKITEEDPIFAF